MNATFVALFRARTRWSTSVALSLIVVCACAPAEETVLPPITRAVNSPDAALQIRNARLKQYDGRVLLVRQTMRSRGVATPLPISRFRLSQDSAAGKIRMTALRQATVDCKAVDLGDGTARVRNCDASAQWDPYADSVFVETYSQVYTTVAANPTSPIPAIPANDDSVGVYRVVTDSIAADDSMKVGLGVRHDGNVVGMVFDSEELGVTGTMSTVFDGGLLTGLVLTVAGEDEQELTIEIAMEGYGQALRMQQVQVESTAYQKSAGCYAYLGDAAAGLAIAAGSALVAYYGGAIIKAGMTLYTTTATGALVRLSVNVVRGVEVGGNLATKLLGGGGIWSGLRDAWAGYKAYNACS